MAACRPALRDYSAADHDISVIKDHRLSGSDRPLGLVELDPEQVVIRLRYGTGLFLVAVTDFGAAAQRLFNAVRRDQVDPARVKGGLHQILIGSKRDGVGFRIDLCHVAAMGGRYPEPAPLAQRIMDDSLMTPQYIALSVNKISGRTVTAAVTADKAGVVTVRNKADILAVFFFSVPEAALRGDLSRRVLVLVPQRELYMGQLVLGHHIEDIALVLGGIEGFEQKVPAGLRIIVLSSSQTDAQTSASGCIQCRDWAYGHADIHR